MHATDTWVDASVTESQVFGSFSSTCLTDQPHLNSSKNISASQAVILLTYCLTHEAPILSLSIL